MQTTTEYQAGKRANGKAATQKIQPYITPDAYRSLRLYAADKNMSFGEVVSAALISYCRKVGWSAMIRPAVPTKHGDN